MTDMRLDYYILHILDNEPGAKNSSALKKMKKNIRNEMKPKKSNRTVVHGDIDGYIELIDTEIPDTASREAAEKVFKNRYVMNLPNSQYDCTGRPFTTWYKLFVRRGTWFAYHNVCYDV